jgi:hypothetical protein
LKLDRKVIIDTFKNWLECSQSRVSSTLVH